MGERGSASLSEILGNGCTQITTSQYIQKARDSGTRVQWSGGWYRNNTTGEMFRRPIDEVVAEFDQLGVRTVECRIVSDVQWTQFSDSLLVVRQRADGTYYSLNEYVQEPTVLNDPDFNTLSTHDIRFVTAFDTRLQKRFLFDGLHRACAVKINYKNKLLDAAQILPFTIIECEGTSLNQLFQDFQNLITLDGSSQSS